MESPVAKQKNAGRHKNVTFLKQNVLFVGIDQSNEHRFWAIQMKGSVKYEPARALPATTVSA
jgi:hypothetical protein